MQEVISKKTLLKIAIPALVTAAIFIFIFQTFTIDATGLLDLDPYWLILSLLLTLSFPLFSTLRWLYLLRGVDIQVDFSGLFKIVWGSWILSIFPGRLGDFIRVVGLPTGSDKTVALGTVFLEKVIDIFSLTSICLIGFFLAGNLKMSVAISALLLLEWLCLLLIVKTAILVPKKFKPNLTLLKEALTKIKVRKAYLVKSALSSGSNWMLSILQVYFLFFAVGQPVSLITITAWLPLAIFVGLIPITIAGMGTRDSALIYFFAPLATSGQILTIGIWYSILGYWLLALLGLPFLKHLLRK